MNIKKIKILSIAGAAGSVFLGFGWQVFEMAVCCRKNKRLSRKQVPQLSHMKSNHPKYKFEKEYEDGKAWCKAQNMEDWYIQSRDGLRLHGYYLPAENAERTVLLSHGYRGSGFGDFAYIARFLHENHCHLLFVDQRCCGASQGEYITFGAKEQYDIQSWAYALTERNKQKLPIYLYGESMGAATVLMASGHSLPEEVRGIISDCGFRSMKGQFQDMAASWFHLHWISLLLLRVDFFCRVLAGFAMKDADTTEAMKRNRRPVLFFHGRKDTYVDLRNSQYNYSVCRAPKELVLIPEARHLCCVYENPRLYREKIMDFFNNYDKINRK